MPLPTIKDREMELVSRLSRSSISLYDEMQCENFLCCGRHLTDLHALLEHLEEVHYNHLSTHNPQHSTTGYTSAPSLPLSSPRTAAFTCERSPSSPNQDQWRLPPILSVNYSQWGFAGPRLASAPLTYPEGVFNAYARFVSDYSCCMPGTQFNGAHTDWDSALIGYNLTTWEQQQRAQSGGCVAPALLSPDTTNISDAAGSQIQPSQLKAQTPLSPAGTHQARLEECETSPTPREGYSSTSLTSGSTVLFAFESSSQSPQHSRRERPGLLSKPFRCPMPNCNKSYKQANGLQYHRVHGTCKFSPQQSLEYIRDLVTETRRRKEQVQTGVARGVGAASMARSGAVQRVFTRNTLLGGFSSPASGLGSTPQIQKQTSSTHTKLAQPIPGPADARPISPATILRLSSSELSLIPTADLLEVELEAERRLKPFACRAGACTKRYKGMNGLKYHSQYAKKCVGWGERVLVHATYTVGKQKEGVLEPSVSMLG